MRIHGQDAAEDNPGHKRVLISVLTFSCDSTFGWSEKYMWINGMRVYLFGSGMESMFESMFDRRIGPMLYCSTAFRATFGRATLHGMDLMQP